MKGLPYEVKSLVAKARDSALLAVETYNRPTALFRSGAYVILMVIAWTALFHAIFVRKHIRPYHRKAGSRRYEKVGGDYKRWELCECLQQHFKDQNPPVRKNLEFFIDIRNKLEHCTMAELDPEIFGECQAMLMNFEETLCGEFGDRYAINSGLSFALQFSRRPNSSSGIDRPQAKAFKWLKQHIDSFRSSLSADVQNNLAYSFKVYLIPKIVNHPSKDAIAVEFVKYDPSKPDEMAKYEQIATLIKPRHVKVANLGLLNATQVITQVSQKLGKPFTHYDHLLCYRHFNTRPAGKATDPAQCDTRYCHYDEVHKDYCYEPDWIAFLVQTLRDGANHKVIIQDNKKKKIFAPKTVSMERRPNVSTSASGDTKL
ncbi:MAG: DUF3644 domain-containing protein [Phycisphaerae bacterium]